MDEQLFTKQIYNNPLSMTEDVKGFVLEGEAKISFPEGRMRMENALDPSLGQKSNFVFWCPENFPADIKVTWDFWPVREPGLCILFFAAQGQKGEDLFDQKLQRRNGEYKYYHSGEINGLHVSYYRRMWETERAFHTCNLRKSKGFHLVCQGADPLPDIADAKPPYHIKLIKHGNEVAFYIDNLQLFHWMDDGISYGQILGGGKIGFRQMAPLIGEYQNLSVFTI